MGEYTGGAAGAAGGWEGLERRQGGGRGGKAQGGWVLNVCVYMVLGRGGGGGAIPPEVPGPLAKSQQLS